jgi:hypothetical protein
MSCIPPPLVHRPVKYRFRPRVVGGQAKKKFAYGALKSEHHIPKDRFRPRGVVGGQARQWTRGSFKRGIKLFKI